MDELIKKIISLLKYKQTVIESERKIMDNKLTSLIWSNESIKTLKFESKCKEYELTSREKDVVRLILQVLPHKQIADKLNLSNSTISKHVYQIYKKCNVHTNMELLKLFLE